MPAWLKWLGTWLAGKLVSPAVKWVVDWLVRLQKKDPPSA